MAGLDITFKIIQLVAALIGLWRAGGADVVNRFLSDQKKRICDERCDVELKRASEKNGNTPV